MTARDGRPRSEKRQRNKAALVRMNEAEYQALTAASAAAGMAPSTYLRETTLAGQNEAAALAAAEAKLADLRKLAVSLGDRSNEPLDPSLPPGHAGRYSDRRLMEPLRRMLLEILDRP